MAEGDGARTLKIRVSRDLSRRLSREARRRRQSRSAVARAILTERLSDGDTALDAEARRQSMLVQAHESEEETLRFIGDVADLKGWH